MDWRCCRYMIINMKRFFVFICSLLSVSNFNCETSNKNVTLLTPKDFQTHLSEEVQLIDVRTSKEFNAGHLNGAKNINFFGKDFLKVIDTLDKEKPVFIYCRSGKRSGKSAVEFQKAGFSIIYDLKGGILKWKSEGFEIAK